MSKKFVAAGVMAASLMAAGAASAAPTEITMWHAMANTLGDWVADVTKDFNAKTPQCHLTSTYKGTYDQTMTSGIAAHRAGRSPNILQVFEVGTATMMFSKGAIVPVGELLDKAGYEFNPKDYIRFMLTGEKATEVADASGTGFFDVKNRVFSDELIAKLGLPRSLFPRCYESYEVAGTVTEEVAKLTGLRAGLPVTAGGGDAVIQTTGTGLVRQGVLGVVVANVDMLVGCAVLAPEWRAVVVALVMAVLSPVMAELGAALPSGGGPDE